MKKQFGTIISGSLAILLASTVSVYAETTLPPQPKEDGAIVYEEGKAGILLVDVIEASAKVVSIDKSNRKLKLLGPDGKEFTTKVGPEAVKFDEIKVNDLITITLGSEIDIKVYKKSEAEGLQESKEGVLIEPEKPGILAAETVTVIADVVAINKKEHTATLQFKDGSKKTFSVRKDVDLSKHNTGEVVVFELTEAVAVNIEPAN